MLRQIAGILVSLSLLSSAPLVHAQPVRISYAGIAGYNVPLWVAQEAGFFKKHGLSADFILIEGAPISIQALLTNEVQLVNMAGSAPVQATLQGAEVVIIATSYNLMPYSLVVHEEIRSAADLRGKRMGVASLGGITEVAGRLALEKLGLGPKDMVFFVAGSDSTRIAAVRSKAVAASIIAPPNLFVAMDMGLKVLADLGDLGVKYPTGVMITARSYLMRNRALVKKFLMGFIEGLHLYAERKDFAMQVMQKRAKLAKPEILSMTHDYFVKNTALIPVTDPGGIKNAIPPDKVGSRRIEDFYDNSLIRELVDEGFVTNVTKKGK